MNRIILASLAVAATTFAVFGPVAPERASAATTSPSNASSASSLELESTPAPIPAQSGGLCGLTVADVNDIIDHYDLEPDLPAVVAALSTPFDCDAYGDLCAVLEPTRARAYACGVWLDLEAHLSVTKVSNRAVGRLSQWGQPCTPDIGACEDICSPYELLHCSGVYEAGGCREVAACNYFSDFEVDFFHFLDVGPI